MAKECGIAESTLKTHLYQKRIVKNGFLINADELYEAYYIKKLTFFKMCALFDVSEPTIREYLKKYNFKIRKTHINKYSSEDVNNIVNLYLVNGLSANQISKKYNTTHTVILRKLRSKNITIRNFYNEGSSILIKDNYYKRILITNKARNFIRRQINPSIIERDKACKMCGSMKNLHIHHILSVKEIVESILIDNPNISDENEFYKLLINNKNFIGKDNLETYCKECHYYKIHKYKRKSAAKP